MSFKSIYLKSCVGLDNLWKRMIFQALIIPYLGGLNKSNKDKVFPIPITDLIFFAVIEQSWDIYKRNNGCLFFHFTCHHDQLNEMLDVFSTTSSLSLVLVLIVETWQIMSNGLSFIIKYLFTFFNLCV